MRHWTENEPRMPGVETDITWADTATGVCCAHRFYEGACGCEEPFDLRGVRADLEVLADALGEEHRDVG